MNAHSESEGSKRRAAPRPLADPERRTAILTAARASFAQKGFHRTTMRDVAGQAGLAEGTLYNHFANKDALLLGLFAALGEQTRTALDPEALAALDLREFMHAFVAAPLRALAQDDHALFRVIVSEALIRPELGQAFAAGLAQTGSLGTQALAGRPELRGVDIPALLQLGTALVMGLTLQHALNHAAPSKPDTLATSITDLLLSRLPGGAA